MGVWFIISENFDSKPQQIIQDEDWLGQGLGGQKVLVVQVLTGAGAEAEVRMGQPQVGRQLSQGLQSRDDGWLFAMCMFCIFSRFAALAAGAAGKKACPAVCSTSPDSD